jgi:hypothetical protein
MAEKQPACIIDVNGCLGDTTNRNHFISDRENRDWEGFFENMMTDTPVDQVHRFCNAQPYHPFFSKVLLITGAPEKYRPLMEKWLEINQVHYDRLFMRGNYQFIKGFEFKRKLYDDVLRYDYDIVLALDDKDECSDMWRELGIPCWLVAPCPYPRVEKAEAPRSRGSNPYRRPYRQQRQPRPR